MIEIWVASVSDLIRAGIDSVLTQADFGRLSQLPARAQLQSRASCGLVRLAVARHLDIKLVDVDIQRLCPNCGGAHGPPTVASDPDLLVSVSHSNDALLVALSRSRHVGIDVEYVGNIDAQLLARQFLAPSERRRWNTARDVLTYWTRKEAISKSIGLGTAVDLRQITVSAPWEPALVTEVMDSRVPPTFRLQDLDLGAEYVATVAGVGSSPLELRRLDGSSLLASHVPTHDRVSGSDYPNAG